MLSIHWGRVKSPWGLAVRLRLSVEKSEARYEAPVKRGLRPKSRRGLKVVCVIGQPDTTGGRQRKERVQALSVSITRGGRCGPSMSGCGSDTATGAAGCTTLMPGKSAGDIGSMGSASSEERSANETSSDGTSAIPPVPAASATWIDVTAACTARSAGDTRAADSCAKQSMISAHTNMQAEMTRAGRESLGTLKYYHPAHARMWAFAYRP